MFLHDDFPVRGETDAGVPVGVEGTQAHVRVAAFDELLQNERAGIAGGSDAREQIVEFFARGQGVDLLLAGELHMDPGTAVCGLADQRERQIRRQRLRGGGFVGDRPRMRDTQLGAQGIEVLLQCRPFNGRRLRIRDGVPGFEFCAMGGDGLDVQVQRTTQHERPGVLPIGREITGHLHKMFDDEARIGHASRRSDIDGHRMLQHPVAARRNCHTDDPVGLVELAG